MVTVVICTYNRSSSLKQTLESLAQMSVPPGASWEVVVVDNNSTDRTREVVEGCTETFGANVRYVFEPEQGLSHARNTAIRKAEGDMIAFTDDDVTVDPNWLSRIKKGFDEFDCLGVAGKVILVWPHGKPPWLEETGPCALGGALASFDLGEKSFELTHPPVGANMAYRRVAFEKYGLFRTSLMGGDDTEFAHRLLRAGDTLMYLPDAMVYHHVEEQRTQKKYFRRWFFNCGRNLIQVFGVPKGAVLYFGIPRYMLRILAESLVRWAFGLNSQKRAYQQMQLFRIVGEIVEARRLLRG